MFGSPGHALWFHVVDIGFVSHAAHCVSHPCASRLLGSAVLQGGCYQLCLKQ
jgi:hypothetical protein